MNRKLVLVGVVALIAASCGSRGGSPIVIEAEDFKRGNVNVDRGELGYGQGIGVLTSKPGGFTEYNFQAPSSGEYKIEFRYASGVSRPLRVLIDGKLINENAAAAETGGFLPADQKWQVAGVVTLTRGDHMMRIESAGFFPHLDKIRLTPQ